MGAQRVSQGGVNQVGGRVSTLTLIARECIHLGQHGLTHPKSAGLHGDSVTDQTGNRFLHIDNARYSVVAVEHTMI